MKLDRYNRQILVNGFGTEGQIKLSDAKILVVGAGGLGAACLPYLAGAGIGHIGIADADIVELSNLHRQVIYTEQDVGSHKAAVAMRNLQAQNGQIIVECFLEKLGAHNALDFAQKFDLIVDCTDNYNAKYAMNDACIEANIPMVSASIEGMSGYMRVFGGQGFLNYRALFNEPALNALNCAQSGVVGSVAGMFGVMQAHEVIKYFTGVGEVADKVMILDMYDFSLQKISLPTEYQSYFKPMKLVKLAQVGAAHLIDVRERDEYSVGHLDAAINWPLSEITETTIGDFHKSTQLALYCVSGARAENAAIRLQQAGYENLTLLSHGML